MKLKFYFSMMFLFLGFLSPSYASFPVESISTEITQTSSVEEEEMTSPVVANSGKSQVAALLLCFFIGIIGIHRFYLGYTWQGVVQILTLGGLGIWTLIDFIRIITGDLQPKDGSYDKTF